MSNVDAMRRLKEDIITSYDARVASVADIAKDTKVLMGRFGDEHKEMSDELRRTLSQNEAERIKETQAEINERIHYVETFLSDFRKEHQQMAKALRTMLAESETTRLEEFKALLESIQTRQKERENEVTQMLDDFQKAHAQMSADLKVVLSKVKPELTAAENERFQQAQAEIKERMETISQMLSDFHKSHAEMSADLRAELAKVKPELTAAEKERFQQAQAEIREREEMISQMLSDFHKFHAEMSGDLRAELAKVKPELTAAEKERFEQTQGEIKERVTLISQMLNEFKEEREGIAAEWNKLCEVMAQRRTFGVERVRQHEKEVRKEAKEAERRAKTEAEEAERKAKAEAEEAERRAKEQMFRTTKNQIYGVIANNPGGIKLTDIGEAVGEKWQKLNPYVRELIDEGKIEKTDNLYILV